MLDAPAQTGSIATLERVLQFAGGRHRLISHNIANISTPDFRPVDIAPEEFQKALREAVEMRNASGPRGELEPVDTRNIRFTRDGMEFDPQQTSDNLLFHDGNDRNLESLMQDMVENFMVFRQAAELLRSRFNLINQAIAERV